MNMIDTHSHLFLEEFAEDLPVVIERARQAGVTHVFMPNIDSTTLQPMLDVAWSLEEGLDRIPLFNDAGNNVAKSLQALVSACKEHFGITPEYKSRFIDSGFYIFKQNDWNALRRT